MYSAAAWLREVSGPEAGLVRARRIGGGLHAGGGREGSWGTPSRLRSSARLMLHDLYMIYIYIYICIYMYICIYVYMYTYVHMLMFPYPIARYSGNLMLIVEVLARFLLQTAEKSRYRRALSVARARKRTTRKARRKNEGETPLWPGLRCGGSQRVGTWSMEVGCLPPVFPLF